MSSLVLLMPPLHKPPICYSNDVCVAFSLSLKKKKLHKRCFSFWSRKEAGFQWHFCAEHDLQENEGEKSARSSVMYARSKGSYTKYAFQTLMPLFLLVISFCRPVWLRFFLLLLFLFLFFFDPLPLLNDEKTREKKRCGDKENKNRKNSKKKKWQ